MKTAMWTMWRIPAIGMLMTMFWGTVLAGTEFSAETLRHGPQSQVASGKLFVGDKRMRIEETHQGQSVIRIIDENLDTAWILFPDRKTYQEHKLQGLGSKPPGMNKTSAENPCNGMPGLTCRKLGEEKIGERTAAKWEITISNQGRTMQSIHWIDKERGIPLREEIPGRHMTQLELVATEDWNGRQVEKWEQVTDTSRSDQPELRTSQWFDPGLGIMVRQEFPGDLVSELKNIRIGKQPDELFRIPADFEPMTIPPGPPGGTIGR